MRTSSPFNQIRVKAPVTWRPPHRAVREDFLYTVLRIHKLSLMDYQASLTLPGA